MKISQTALLTLVLSTALSVSATPISNASPTTSGSTQVHEATLPMELLRKMENESFWGSIAKKAEQRTHHASSEEVTTAESDRPKKVIRPTQNASATTALDLYLSVRKPHKWTAHTLEPEGHRLGYKELLPTTFGKYTELASYIDPKGDAKLKVVRLDGWGNLYEHLYDNQSRFLQDQAKAATGALVREYLQGTMRVAKETVAGCKAAKFIYISSKDHSPVPHPVWQFPYKNQLYIVVAEDKNSSPEFAGTILNFISNIKVGS